MSDIELTIAQVAVQCGVNTRTIENWQKKNVGFPAPIRRSTRHIRWHKADIDAWNKKKKSKKRG